MTPTKPTLFIEILNGELLGTRAALREGFSIGRRKGTLTIRDSKLSGMHVIVEERQDGSLWMVDAGSSNGIKHEGVRVKDLKLEPGVTFMLGRTDFKIIDSYEDLTHVGKTYVEDQPAVQHTVTRDWYHWAQSLAERGKTESQEGRRQIMAFDPAVTLKIVRGPQSGTEWTLGYGPRAIGSESVDLNLEDTEFPGVCFKLIPDPDGVAFSNETDKLVKLNGEWVAHEVLKDGDLIDISHTQIQVVLGKKG